MSRRRSPRLVEKELSEVAATSSAPSSQGTLVDSAITQTSDLHKSPSDLNDSLQSDQSSDEDYIERRIRRAHSSKSSNQSHPRNSSRRGDRTNGHEPIAAENQMQNPPISISGTGMAGTVGAQAGTAAPQTAGNTNYSISISCPVSTCSSIVRSSKALQDHLNDVHLDYEDNIRGFSRCRTQTCRKFFTFKGLGSHMASAHRVAPTQSINRQESSHENEQLNPAVDNETPPPRDNLRCPFPNCSRGFSYASSVTLIHHLNNDHQNDPTPPGIASDNYVRCSVPNCGHFCHGDRGVKLHHRISHHDMAREQPQRHAISQEQLNDLMEGDITDVSNLMSFYTMALKRLHKSWVTPFYACINILLRGMLHPDVLVARESTAAHFILPGLISRLCIYRSKEFTRRHRNLPVFPLPLQMLLSFTEGDPTPTAAAQRILSFATSLQRVYPLPSLDNSRSVPVDAKLRGMARRAEHHCADGELAKAARIIEEMEIILDKSTDPTHSRWTPPASSNLQQELERLFPAPSDNTNNLGNPNIPDSRYAAIQLEEEQVRKALQTRNVNKSKGRSGWTNHLLRALATRGTEDQITAYVSHLTRLFNTILAGMAPEEVHEFWVAARMCMQPKASDPTGQSKRPIGIGEVLYRCLGSIVIQLLRDLLARRFQPHQLGVGVKGGVEIAATLVDMADALDNGLMNLDVVNAYGSIERPSILAGLQSICTEVIALFRWVYGRPIPLCNNQGVIVHHATKGVLQGDPLSSLFFCAGIHSLLTRVQDYANSIPAQHDVEGNVMVVAILDDISIVAPLPILFELAPYVDSIMRDMNLHMNMSKSFILGRRANSTPNPPDGWTILSGPAKTLGRPLGTADDQEDYLDSELRKKSLPLKALSRIDPVYAFRLLKFSYAHRFDYLGKVLSHSIDRRVFKLHQEEVEHALHVILCANQPRNDFDELAMRSGITQLPTRLGGLGLCTPASILGSRQRLLTCHRGSQFLEEFYPSRVDSYLRRFDPRPSDAYADQIHQLSQMEEDDADYAVKTRRAVERLQTDLQRSIRQGLIDKGAFSSAALLLSYSSPDTSYVLTLQMDPPSSFIPRNNFFREYVRNRLLIPFVSGTDGMPGRCSCDQDLILQPHHALSCPHNNCVSLRRHDEIRDSLQRLLRDTNPDAPPHLITIEPQDHNGIPFTDAHRPDIRYCKDGRVAYIDVAVIDPSAATNVRACESHLFEGRAAAMGEERKRAQYAGMAGDFILLPFCVESSGRLGKEACNLLEMICRDHPRPYRRFIRDLSCILARHTGMALSYCRSRLFRELKASNDIAARHASESNGPDAFSGFFGPE